MASPVDAAEAAPPAPKKRPERRNPERPPTHKQRRLAVFAEQANALKEEKRRSWICLRSDPAVRTAYITALSETGSYVGAAEKAGVNRRASLALRDEDPHFAEECEQALETYRQWLVSVAQKRATEGWQEPIVGGRNRDEVVAHKPVHSDRLMELFLKRHIPEFRDKSTVEQTGTVTQINVHASLEQLANLSPRAQELLHLLLAEVEACELQANPKGKIIDVSPEAGMPADWAATP